MSSLPITPPKARVDPAPTRSASPPGGSSGETDFAALLSQTTTQARTAPAEGRNTRPAQSDQARRRDDDDRAQRTQRPDDAQTDATSRASDDASATQSQPTAKDATDPSAGGGDQQPKAQDGATAQGQQGSSDDADAAASTAAATAASLAAQASAAPVATAAAGAAGTVVAAGGAPAPTPGARTATAAGAHAHANVPLPATVDDAAAPAANGATNPDGTPVTKLQLPAELLDAARAAGATKAIKNVPGARADGLPPAPTLPPSAAAAAAAAPQAGAAGQQAGAGSENSNNGAQAQPAAPPPVAAAQPAATLLTAVPTAPGTAQLTRASVAQTAERVQELVRIATTRAGNARATLQLRPEALGQVDVQLRTTKDGLVATIAAHDQAGLEALQNAANELRRTLEDRGVQLHSLDLQLGAGTDSGFTNQGDARQASQGRGARGASYGLDADDPEAEAVELSVTRTQALAGELVDVTA